jgi:hypothetical protein
MGLEIVNRYINTVNGGNDTFLYANAGQVITERIVIKYKTPFKSTNTYPVQITDVNTLVLLGNAPWSELGFLIGDTITVTGDFDDLNGNTFALSVTDTIQDIVGNTLITATDVFTSVYNTFSNTLSPSAGNSPIIVSPARSAPEQVIIRHNTVENSSGANFASLLDSYENVFEFNGVSTMNVGDSILGVQTGNKSGGSYISAELERYPSTFSPRYAIVLQYFLPDYEGDGTRPYWFEDSECLKSVWRVECNTQHDNPNGSLTGVFASVLGNSGWYNEEHNGGVNNFNIVSKSIKDIWGVPIPEIRYNENNIIDFTISSTRGSMSADYELRFDLLTPTDWYKNNQYSHLQNRNTSTANTTGYANQWARNNEKVGLIGLTSSISGGQLVGQFVLSPTLPFLNFVEQHGFTRYRLSVTVRSGAGSNDTVSLILYEGDLTSKQPNKVAIPGVVTMLEHEMANFGTLPFFSFDGSSLTEDDLVLYAQIQLPYNKHFLTASMVSYIIRSADGAVFNLERFNFNLTGTQIAPDGSMLFNISQPRPQLLDGPRRNILEIKKIYDDVSFYAVEVLYNFFDKWQYWLANNAAFADFYDPSLPNNGQSQNWQRYNQPGYVLRHELNLTDTEGIVHYIGTNNSILDYNRPEVTTVINIFDQNNNPSPVFIQGQTMKIQAVHTSHVGNFSPPLGVGVGRTWGWIGYREHETDPRKTISTVWAWTGQDTPLKPLQGETRAKLTVTGAVAVVECLLDVTSPNITISARIDDKYTEPEPLCTHYLTAMFDYIESQSGKFSDYEDWLNIDLNEYEVDICCPDCNPFAIAEESYAKTKFDTNEYCCMRAYDYTPVKASKCDIEDFDTITASMAMTYSNSRLGVANSLSDQDFIILQTRLAAIGGGAAIDIYTDIVKYGLYFTCEGGVKKHGRL